MTDKDAQGHGIPADAEEPGYAQLGEDGNAFQPETPSEDPAEDAETDREERHA